MTKDELDRLAEMTRLLIELDEKDWVPGMTPGQWFEVLRLARIGMEAEERERFTHRHKKRGTLYSIVGVARLQSDSPLGDMAHLVVYRSHEGELWARAKDEFNDGRFERLEPRP